MRAPHRSFVAVVPTAARRAAGLITACALAFGGLTGCDEAEKLLGAADSGPSGVVLEGDPETRIADLEGEQVEAICAAFYAAATRQVPPETRCAVVGIPAGLGGEGDPATGCADAVSTCVSVSAVGGNPLPDLPLGGCFLQQADPTCEGTLATLQPCLDSMADTAVGQLRANLTCALATTPGVPIPSLEAPEADGVEACARFTATCPSFFGESGGGSDAGVGDAGR